LSAGGHLTALLGTSGGVKELEGDGGHAKFRSTIQAAVPMGAQTDLMSERTRMISQSEDRGKIWRQFLKGSQKSQPENYRLASPLTHLDASDPPMLFIAGANDDPSTHADNFRGRMKKLGTKQELLVIDDAPHAFLRQQKWFDQAVDTAVKFFQSTLKRDA
jgi:dipeptidyl aminopeptidase/acylaminoacyl peptidase